MRLNASLHAAARIVAAAALFVLIGAPVRAQQQTGSLVLEISDPAGAPIAGAEVSIESERTATRLATSDDRGRARFLLLPPGTYIVEVRAEGFTATRREIQVALGGAGIERFTLAKGELTETVVVTANPEVDVTKTSTSDVYTSEDLANLQLGSANRSYLSVLGKSAGVVGGGGNPAVHGATIGENVYLIDGVNTTDPVTGTFGLLTNFDAIEQVELTTGGFQAEYGWATGGYVNQVTKSGTNEFDGTVDLRYYDDSMIENTTHAPGEEAQEFRQMSFTLGGPIMKDKAWFFVGLENNLTNLAVAGAPVTRKFDGASYIAKLTFEPVPRHRIAFQYSADPAEISNDNASPDVAAEAGNFQKQGANFFKLTYWGGLSDKWAISTNVGMYQSVLDTTPLNDTGVPSITDGFSGYLFRNYNDAQYTDRGNDQLSTTLERAWSGKHGDHDLKFGFDAQRTELKASQETPGGEAWFTAGDNPATPETERDFLDVDTNGDTVPDSVYERDVTTSAGTARNPGRNTALFVQDSWRHRNFTLDYGLRYERAQADRDDKTEVVDVSLLQPRLGMSYDLKGDRKQQLYWSLSRRMHPGILAVPSVVNSRNNVTDFYYNEQLLSSLVGGPVDCNGDGSLDFAFVYCGSAGGPSGSTVDPDLKATYLDELIVGWKRSLKARHSLGARLVLNKTKDIIEDTLDDPGTQTYIVTNLPGLKRSYEAIEMEYSWRFRRGALFANWTIGRARGNVEYTQGIGSDFDVPGYHDVNRNGYLSTDRRHRIKVYGFVNLPKKWSLHYDMFFGTGAPYERVQNLSGADPVTGVNLYGVEYLDKRGSHRLPSIMTLDVDVRKDWLFGEKEGMKLELIGTVANILGANSVTGRREIYSGDEDLNTPGIQTSWGRATNWQDPRTLEVGLRFEF